MLAARARVFRLTMGPKRRGTRRGEGASPRASKAPRSYAGAGPGAAPSLAVEDTSPSGRFWLVKGEYETRMEKTPTGEDYDTRFNLDDLRNEPGGTTRWDGVRNYSARNALRSMAVGDSVLFYHSNVAKKKGSIGPHVAGIAKVVTAAFPDPLQWDSRSPYYDPKAPSQAECADGGVEPRWWSPEIRFERALDRGVSLDEPKEAHAGGETALKDLLLLQSSRLSVQEVPPVAFDYIVKLSSS